MNSAAVRPGLDAQRGTGDVRDEVRRGEGVGDTALLGGLPDSARATIADEQRGQVPGLVRDAVLERLEHARLGAGLNARHRIDPVRPTGLGLEDVADLEDGEVGEAARDVAVRDSGQPGQQAAAQLRLVAVEGVRERDARGVAIGQRDIGERHEGVREHLGEAAGGESVGDGPPHPLLARETAAGGRDGERRGDAVVADDARHLLGE